MTEAIHLKQIPKSKVSSQADPLNGKKLYGASSSISSGYNGPYGPKIANRFNIRLIAFSIF
jgi:hypothetical protein